jgi:SAM-dependent methyltransferase
LNCLLCTSQTQHHFTDPKSSKEYYHCPTCDLIFLDPKFRLARSDEATRYSLHHNDINDPAYQKFVSPLYELIKARIDPSARCLDFGCGDGPVLAHLLERDGYNTALYDPQFRPDRAPLLRRYDFIYSTEVVEHLFNPLDEFTQLKGLLNPKGQMAIMTLLHSPKTDFANWFYRKDPTHVCFYSKLTLEWLGRHLEFASSEAISDRIVWLTL